MTAVIEVLLRKKKTREKNKKDMNSDKNIPPSSNHSDTHKPHSNILRTRTPKDKTKYCNKKVLFEAITIKDI